MFQVKVWVVILFSAALAFPSGGGRKRDPLTEAEVDQLRETTQEPPKRIKLYIKFAKERMASIEKIRAGANTDGTRGKQTHDLLEDFDTIAEELDRNIDMYDRQKSDLRKPLKEAIDAYVEWQQKLEALKKVGATDSKAVEEFKEYGFALDSAKETVDAGLETARDTLEEQNKTADEAKRKKPAK